MNFDQPQKLLADNFTPLTRTPWAGKIITTKIKDQILPDCQGRQVGESWEFSLDPGMMSRLVSGSPLDEYVAQGGKRVLGESSRIEVLVKLLNAASPLSLQLHPQDNDADLQSHESGKPESWLVLDHTAGAGLYLGFEHSLTRLQLRELLESGADLRDHLKFVPVQRGDYFEILPHVPHAIGPGVLLLEPQRVVPGKSGKTYRMWDWNRLYDDRGQLSPDGEPRELHIDAALKLVDPERQWGDAFVDSLRRAPITKVLGAAEIKTFPANSYCQLTTITAPETTKLSLDAPGFAIVICLQGEISWQSDSLPKGQTALIPHQALPLIASLTPDSEICLLTPANNLLSANLA